MPGRLSLSPTMARCVSVRVSERGVLCVCVCDLGGRDLWLSTWVGSMWMRVGHYNAFLNLTD